MSTEIQKITDFDENLSLLPGQFDDSVKLRAVLSQLNTQAKDVEDAIFEVRDEFWLETAAGVQLDVVGSIFNAAREGRTDEVYRAFLQASAGNVFSGTPEEIIDYLINILGFSNARYSPGGVHAPAEFYIRTDDYNLDPELLNTLSPAGVGGFFSAQLRPVSSIDDDIVAVSSGKKIVAVYRVEFDVLVTELGEEIETETGKKIIV